MLRSPLSFFLVAFFALLAGQAAALDINVTRFDKSIEVKQPADLVSATIPDVVRNDCTDKCSAAVTAINACAATDNACLCNNVTTVPVVLKCQQCMFAQQIARFKEADSELAGSTNALTGYMTACNAALNMTLDKTLFTLKSPDNWDGPFGQELSLPTTVVAVIFTALFGGGLISVLCTM